LAQEEPADDKDDEDSDEEELIIQLQRKRKGLVVVFTGLRERSTKKTKS